MSDKPSLLQEFREFAVKGNVMDLAVGVLIGAAFGKIVTSVVADIVTPLLSPLLGKLDFANQFISMNGVHYATIDAAKKAGAATLNYGLFFTNVLDFIVIAFVIFLAVKAINRFRRQDAAAPAEDAAPPAPTREEILLTEIRDAILGARTGATE